MHAVRLLATILRNQDLRRAELAWTLGITGQSAWLVVLLVVANERGGIDGVALVSLARTLPAAFAAPFVTTLADRFPRERVLLAAHLAEAALVGLAALGALGGASLVALSAIAVVEGAVATLQRPANMALLPGLARSPQELIGGNAVASTLEGVGALLGPALAGLVLALGGTALGLVVPLMAFGFAASAIATVRPARLSGRAPVRRAGGAALGVRVLGERREAAYLIGVLGVQTFVRGALLVLVVSAALGPLGLGEAGVGYLNAAIGAGGVIGAFATTALIGVRTLAMPFSVSLAAWGLPIAVLGIVLHPVAALGLLALVGVANASLDVAGFSLIQRIVPNEVRGRVFGVLEMVVALTVGLGSLAAPLLVGAFGVGGALVAVGMLLPVTAVASVTFVRRADARAVIPEQELELLRGVTIFAPLPMTSLEALASVLVSERATAGTELVREGEVGDRFYVLSTGDAEVVSGGRVVRRLQRGEGFGEIALLRDVPRTATVRLTTDAEVFWLDRSAFLEAVTGSAASHQVAERVVTERLPS